MFKTVRKEIEQWELENPEAAAAYDLRLNLGILILLLPMTVPFVDWTMRWIPYGWPRAIRERHEEVRAEILRFFGHE